MLPDQTVQAFAQGYLWVGTKGGLLRFYGARFVVYDHTNAPGLSESSINCLAVSRGGRFWIGTEDGVSCAIAAGLQYVSHWRDSMNGQRLRIKPDVETRRRNALIKVVRSLYLAFSLVLANTSVRAEITLPAVLAEHMVLQRDQPVHLWGRADPGEQVRVSFRGHEAGSAADALGRWSVYLAPGSAGGPFALTIAGKNQITFTDILVGDLWIASGQSNMEFSMAPNPPWTDGTQNFKAEIAGANYPKLRLFQVKVNTSGYPMDDLVAKQNWIGCTPESVASFSAVAYFFGRELLETERIPIGLIESNVGGTPAEAWTSLDALTSDTELMPVFSARSHMMSKAATNLLQQKAEKLQDDHAKAHHQATPQHPWRPDIDTWAPAALFNAMVAPLTSLPLRGVIWYQAKATRTGNVHLFMSVSFRS